MTKYFVDDKGALIGAFGDDTPAPAGGRKVTPPPHDGRAVWTGKEWALPIETARADAMSTMVTWIDSILSRFTAKYPKHERDAWPLLALAAKAHLAGENQRMILNEAAIVGDAPDVVAARIVAKSTFLSDVVDRTRGLRQNAEAAILAAQTASDVDAAVAAAQTAFMNMLDATMNQDQSVNL